LLERRFENAILDATESKETVGSDGWGTETPCMVQVGLLRWMDAGRRGLLEQGNFGQSVTCQVDKALTVQMGLFAQRRNKHFPSVELQWRMVAKDFHGTGKTTTRERRGFMEAGQGTYEQEYWMARGWRSHGKMDRESTPPWKGAQEGWSSKGRQC
jgi:hypothetical protein